MTGAAASADRFSLPGCPLCRLMATESEAPRDAGDRAKLVANESAKLTATYVNGVAIAILAVGGLAPVFSGRLAGIDFGAALLGANLLLCATTSAALHWLGRRILRTLR
ncbi:amino acid transporter protein [Methylobacterium sp. WL12]|uniref:amino acid transporter protein n=1 Tax=Methylobacterium sp. WL12 TaxID=2603890 RepID=UPI001FEDB3DB|nr:amino acid transporter protein [Methylobacterium sp. WL12]